MGSSPSTHSLVSGNLNDGVSYTRKTSMLTKRLVHALPYHATKTWALNSGSSSIANSFTLCIHSSSGHPGDTKNGRTYMTKCWRNDDIMVESERGNGVQRRGTKKAYGTWVWEDRRWYSTHKDCSGCVHQRLQRTQTLPTCIVSGS